MPDSSTYSIVSLFIMFLSLLCCLTYLFVYMSYGAVFWVCAKLCRLIWLGSPKLTENPREVVIVFTITVNLLS